MLKLRTLFVVPVLLLAASPDYGTNRPRSHQIMGAIGPLQFR